MAHDQKKEINILNDEGKFLVLLYKESEDLKEDLKNNSGVDVIKKIVKKIIIDFLKLQKRHEKVEELLSHWIGDFEEEVAQDSDVINDIGPFLKELKEIKENITDYKRRIEVIVRNGVLEKKKDTIRKSVDNICILFSGWINYEQKMLNLVHKLNEFVKYNSGFKTDKLLNYQNIQKEPEVHLNAIFHGLGKYSNDHEKCVNVFNRWAKSIKGVKKLEGFNLSGSNLSLFDFSGFVFSSNVNLTKANLKGANLIGANLTKANLEEANLEGASLKGANLYGANLYGANLQGVDLTKAHLDRAHLYRAHLDGVKLTKAKLYEANLDGADLIKAHLEGADLRKADLKRADLKRAHLIGANLYQANLKGAKLEGSNLTKAKLDFLDLTSFNLDGTIFSDASMYGCKIKKIYILLLSDEQKKEAEIVD